MDPSGKLSQKLIKRRETDALRTLSLPNRGKIDLYSNDYLGLASQPLINPITVESLGGATGSRLISGNMQIAEDVEADLAKWLEAEDALIFSSGYAANLGLISSVADHGDTIIYDALCHASIRDAIRLSNASGYKFQHNDIQDLELKLKTAKGAIFVVVESVYSMDGDESPLHEISALVERHGANLIVDEAHAVGVYGPDGGGKCKEHGMSGEVLARVVGFGKALGYHGGAVVGSRVLKQYLVNHARSFIYTTGMPVQYYQLLGQAIKMCRSAEEERDNLQGLISYFKDQMGSFPFLQVNSPIQSLMVGGNSKTKQLAEAINEKGIACKAILHPTISKGSERIRFVLHSFNTEDELDQLKKALEELWPKDIS